MLSFHRHALCIHCVMAAQIFPRSSSTGISSCSVQYLGDETLIMFTVKMMTVQCAYLTVFYVAPIFIVLLPTIVLLSGRNYYVGRRATSSPRVLVCVSCSKHRFILLWRWPPNETAASETDTQSPVELQIVQKDDRFRKFMCAELWVATVCFLAFFPDSCLLKAHRVCCGRKLRYSKWMAEIDFRFNVLVTSMCCFNVCVFFHLYYQVLWPIS